MVTERLQAPNDWPLFTSPQKPANPSWRFDLFPLCLSAIHSLRPLRPPSSTRPAVPARLARHSAWWMRPGICLRKGKSPRGRQHRCCQVTAGCRRGSSLAPSGSGARVGHAEEPCPCSVGPAVMWLSGRGRYRYSACDTRCWPAPI